MIRPIDTIKSWFRTGLRPTEVQFSDAFDSFFHKSEKIPTANVDELLLNTIDNKANKATTIAGYGITDCYTKTEVDNKVAAVYHVKGSSTCAEISALTNQEQGDVYNVSDAGTITWTGGGSITVAVGDNVVWDGTGWDKLSSEIDLSVFYTKTQTDVLLNDKQDALTVSTESASTKAIDPNKLYIWGEIASLTITLNAPADATVVNEYMFQFESGATATTLAIPSVMPDGTTPIKWMKTPTIEANKKYQVSILNGIALIVAGNDAI